VKLKIMAVDPGDRRIGVAISDDLGVIANPLKVIMHKSRQENAKEITSIAKEKEVTRIIIGCSLDSDGELTIQGRKATRLAEVIREMGIAHVELWDEFDSTRIARFTRYEMGVRRSKRIGHLDELAATIILQSYLDAQRGKDLPNGIS
jgi:putative Holliday junction resolvase